MKRVVFVAAIFTACGGSKPAPATPPPATDPPPAATTPPPTTASSDGCTAAIDNTMTISGEKLKSMGLEQMIPKIAAIMLKHCNDDKWSAEALQCMSAGKTNLDMQKCQKMLDADQTQKVSDDLTAMASANAGSGAQ